MLLMCVLHGSKDATTTVCVCHIAGMSLCLKDLHVWKTDLQQAPELAVLQQSIPLVCHSHIGAFGHGVHSQAMTQITL